MDYEEDELLSDSDPEGEDKLLSGSLRVTNREKEGNDTYNTPAGPSKQGCLFCIREKSN